MWKFSKAEVERTTLISCLDYGEGAILASLSPYLFRCGVLHRLFRFRSFHNLLTDERNQLHTFCFYAIIVLGVGARNSWNNYEKDFCNFIVRFALGMRKTINTQSGFENHRFINGGKSNLNRRK